MIDLRRDGDVFVLQFDVPENRFRPDNVSAWHEALDEVEALIDNLVTESQHALADALSVQVRNAVLGDYDVAQVARDGDVPITEHDVRSDSSARFARAAQLQHGMPVRQGVRLGYEVVLPAYTTHDATVVQTV